ncbi:hypothetical protein [Acuticoccus sp. I52.16.1]|uniref:hypothetical protein n=1 Tax=Acuticoccus sp. I52.16.1 TaxID=2928472 RepID=UPI001FD49B1A|nr:hypothetical protein [Acuticoccus sp. I52.16.1]UOM34661.1 hypothetical protein MRB58_00130 [Acuticoccus sp. I52.16.1]
MMLEALCALVLSALVLAGVSTVLSLMARAGDRAAARAETVEATTRLVDAIRRDLTATIRARWAGDTPAFVFSGSGSQILFAARGADGRATVVVLQALGDGEAARLVRTSAPLPSTATAAADLELPPAEVVARGPVGFRFAGRTEPDAAEATSGGWPSGPRMPDAVLVDVGDGIVDRIALPIDADPGCAAAPDDADAFCTERPRAADPIGEPGR